MLALPPINPDEYTHPEVYGSICIVQKAVEPAGRSFHAYQVFKFNSTKVEQEDVKGKKKGKKQSKQDDSDSEGEVIDAAAEKRKAAEYEKKRKTPGEANRLRQALEGENMYKLLRIDEGASTDEIRLGYRKAALMYHPDKAKSSEDPEVAKMTPEQLKAKFLSVQTAFELLTNPATRRMYDSQIPFDETVPGDNEAYLTPAEFFARFEPVFSRNARFSVRRPVPTLGTMESTPKELDKFYTFWKSFQTWRDFAIHDEYDLNDAECRDERRWMEKNNKKTREKYESAEKARIRKLIDTCEKKDPRIAKRKEEEEQRKQAEKQAKQDAIDAKKRAEEEAKQAEAKRIADIQRKEEEIRLREKQEKEDYKARIKIFRSMIRTAHKWTVGHKDSVEYDLVHEDICLALGPDELAGFIGEISGAAQLPPMPEFPSELKAVFPSPQAASAAQQRVVDLFNDKMKDRMESRKKEAEEKKKFLDEQRKAVEAKRLEEERQKKLATEWTVDELSLLAKALVKYPAGINRRWMMISEMLQTRTSDEVVAKAREMTDTSKTLKSMQEKVNQDSFKTFQKANPNALKSTGASADIRGHVGTADLEMTVDTPSVQTEAPAATPAAPAPSTPAPAAPAPVVQPAAVATAPEAETEWTKEQQSQLEQALSKYPATMGTNERWTAIASEVTGKTKKECAARFKYIKEVIAAKKAATGQ